MKKENIKWEVKGKGSKQMCVRVEKKILVEKEAKIGGEEEKKN